MRPAPRLPPLLREAQRLRRDKEIQDKIPAKGSNDSTATLKNELREKLNAQMQQMKDLSAKRTKLVEEIAAIQAGLKKKSEAAKSEKDKLGYKTVDEIDAQIKQLELDLQSGQAKLIEEKRMVAEISNLKKARKVLEGHSSQQSSAESEKAKIDAIRAELKTLDGERDAVREATNATRAELNTVSDSLKETRVSFSGLLEQKKAAKAAVDAAFDKLRTARADFKKAKDDYFAWEREERNKRQEAFKARQAEEREARIVAQAERELEDAEIPAFSEEISLCSALIQFLNSQAGSSAAAAAKPASRPASGRAIDSAMPAGATLMVRKADRDDDFMVLGKKNKKNAGKSANGTNGAAPAAPASTARPIRLDIVMVNQFISLGLAIPVSTDDIPATLEQLEAKKKTFMENQAAQTAANKKAAQERIAKLRESAKEAEPAPAAEA
ncbi:multicopy suppressor of BFA (Brefeldin A) [Polyrhizophydium stewartii]|uniref:Multicopy suppressor of BFA (Brefeldin A) n=1 Tax=Polyrhizophydium stewartii TaxID=2732419 RepID=A0ABR4N6G8_9FUNG